MNRKKRKQDQSILGGSLRETANSAQSADSALVQQTGTSQELVQKLQAEHTALRETLRRTLHNVAITGMADGSQNRPDSEHIGICDAERTMLHQHDRTMEEVTQCTLRIRQQVEHSKATKKVYLEDENLITLECKEHFREEEEQALEDAKHHVKRPKLSPRLWWMQQQMSSVMGVSSLLEEQIAQLNEQLIQEENTLSLFKEKLKGIAIRKSFYDYGIIYWGILSCLLVVEFFVNFEGFKNIAGNNANYTLLLLGGIFALLQPLFAHLTGTSWAHGPESRPSHKVWGALTVCVCLLLTLTRWEAGGHWTLIVVNSLLAMGTVGLSYLHGKLDRYFGAQRRQRQIRTKLKRFESWRQQMNEAYEARCQSIHERYDSLLEKAVKQEKHTLQIAVSQDDITLAQLQQLHQQSVNSCRSLYEMAVQKYRQLNQEARKRAGFAPVKEWGHTPPPAGETSTPIRRVSAIAILLSVGLMSCNPSLPERHVEFGYDQSEQTYARDVAPIKGGMIDWIIPDGPENRGKGTITLSMIGETSEQPSTTLMLDASPHFLLRNEQVLRTELDSFERRLERELEKITVPTPEMDKSYIYRNLYYRLQALAKKPGERLFIIESDLLLNEPEISFYSYRNDLNRLLAERDSIIARLSKAYPLPDLTGIRIIGIHQPSPEDDALYEEAKRFMRYMWEDRGAVVEFYPNYPQLLPPLTAIN